MAHPIADYANILKSEPIVTLQIDLCTAKHMAFANTIIREQLKLIAPNLAPIINEHACPQNSLMSCPYTIINNKHLRDKEATYKLLLALMDLSQERIRQEQQQGEYYRRGRQHFCILLGLLQLCQQLSEVATNLTQDDLNPFYLFLNPLLKWREHNKLIQNKRRLQSSSQYFDKNQQFNQDYFLYRLYHLEAYVLELRKKPLPEYQNKFINICIVAMFKHFKVNNPPIYEVATACPLFQNIESEILLLAGELNQIYQKAIQQKKTVSSFYGMFRLTAEKPEKKDQELQPFKEKLYRAMVKPVTVTCVVLVLMRLF